MTMHTRIARTLVATAVVTAVATATIGAQAAPRQAATLDRTKQPVAPASPTTRIPTWTKAKLANGAELIVSVKRDLPLVSFTIAVVGGALNFESDAKLGVAGFAAQMMTEGTTTKSADALSDAQQMLGTSINVGIGAESGTIGFTALKDRFDAALALAADMMLNSTYPADALERIRGRTLVGLQQARDQPNTIAANVFSKVNYGDAHPYGRVVTEATIKAITREDVAGFAREYFKPGRAVITVVGDVDPARVRASIEKAFAAWAAGGERPSFSYPQPPARKARAIYLVDKPAAAQSVFQLGHIGPDRYTPDYYALQVMNTLLGQLFQSRLNANIREQKGYSYGVSSSYAYGRGPGAFRAGGGIMTAKTDSALIEFMKELRGVQGAIPFTDDELTQGKDALVQSLPETFASVGGVRGAISGVYVQGLGDAYYQEYAAKVRAVTKDDLVRVAKKYIDIDNLNIIIVGDRATIEEPLSKTGIAPVIRLDVDGRPVITP
ncbi:MAG: insulinase family protein [Gemmatimonadetes bacterium]|nr:insulinase family protein [Gemmatimonadota bacterium]